MPWFVLVMEGRTAPSSFLAHRSDAFETALMPWSRPLRWISARRGLVLLAALPIETLRLGWVAGGGENGMTPALHRFAGRPERCPASKEDAGRGPISRIAQAAVRNRATTSSIR